MENNLRYLSTFERFLWLLDQIEPAHFCVAAQVEGATTVNGWRAAIAALQRRHPFFASSIKTDASGQPYFHYEHGNRIPLRVMEGNALARMDVEIAKELDEPFREPDAILARAVLLHEKHRSVLILAAHHSIGDGISLAHAVRDLVQSLSGQMLSPLPVPSSNEQLMGIPQRKKQNQGDEASELPWKIAPLNPAVQGLRAHVSSLRFTAEMTGYLRDRARQEKTTVNAAIGASMALATRKLQAAEEQTARHIFFPISTRKMLGQGDDCVLLTAGGMVDAQSAESADFWEVARQIKAGLAPLQELDYIIAERKQFHAIFEPIDTPEGTVQMARQALTANFILSNIGNLTFDAHYGHLSLEALWGPAILLGSRKNQQVIGATTVNGNLALIYSSYAPIDRLLETMSGILMEACAEKAVA